MRQRLQHHLELGVTWSCPLRQSQQCQLCSRHQKKCSVNQGCHKRFYRHMFFRIIYFFPFETSATASCGYTGIIYKFQASTQSLPHCTSCSHPWLNLAQRNHHTTRRSKGSKMLSWRRGFPARCWGFLARYSYILKLCHTKHLFWSIWWPKDCTSGATENRLRIDREEAERISG